jgi:hypothetical protein
MKKRTKLLTSACVAILLSASVASAAFLKVNGISISAFGAGTGISGAVGVSDMHKTLFKASTIKIMPGPYEVGVPPCGAGLYRSVEGGDCVESLANYYSPAGDDAQYACDGTDVAPAGSDSIDDCEADPFGGIEVEEHVGLYWATDDQKRSIWSEAYFHCSGLGGDVGWRLATKEELVELYNAGITAGHLRFHNSRNYYWSSSYYNTTNRWYVDMVSGTIDAKGVNSDYSVLCVHD